MSFLWTWNNMQTDVTHNLQINNWHFRSSRPEVFYKKVVLEISQNSLKNTCTRVSFLIKFQTSGFSYRTPSVATSDTHTITLRLVKLQHTTWKCFGLQFAGSQVTDSQIPGSCECTSCLPSCQMTEDLVNYNKKNYFKWMK